ncbi:MAG: hypothetical protein ABGY95_12265 [Rubritalea sp.]|uniref:hypothetical protein n=1 Tax=Rubritalea sp. TaxID=2109375 RepID=UPI003242EBB3
MSKIRNLTNEEWQFLEELLTSLHVLGIICPILRNYESLPGQIGNDLDIFVPRSRLKEVEGIFCAMVTSHGGELVKKFKKDTFTAWWVRIGGAPLLHVDLFNGAFYWRGRQLESDEAVRAGTRKHILGFDIPRPAHQAFSMFVTSLIWGGFYKAKYGSVINSLLADENEAAYFESMMLRNFPTAPKSPFCFDESPPEKLAVPYARSLRNDVKLRWLKTFKLSELYAISRYWCWEILNLCRPSGEWVLMVEGQEAAMDGVMDGELMSTYGGETVMSYDDVGGGLHWLWFRLRHIQRRMARNELVFVQVKATVALKVLKRLGGRPDQILAESSLLEPLGCLKSYSKENESVWVKTERRGQFK